MSGADAPLRSTALKLAPLLVPYKKQGRLVLRIERMPQLARLSAGRNNGDNTWSLTLDELEDLSYVFPETSSDAHTLAVRIIGLESGSTLAVLDVVVSPNAIEADGQSERLEAASPNIGLHDAQLRRLREDLARTREALAARETELAALKETTEAPLDLDVSERIEAAISLARSVWKNEMDARLVEASEKAAAELARSRAAWDAEQKSQRVAAESDIQVALDDARERLLKESKEALSKAEKTWKAEEAERLAAAEAQWRESAKALAPRSGTEAPQKSGDAKELAVLREKVAKLEKDIAAQDEILVETNAAAEDARVTLQREHEDSLRRAERAWKAEEAARMSAVRSEWQSEAAETEAKAIAAAEARYEEVQAELIASKAEAKGAETVARATAKALAAATARYESAEENLAAMRADADGAAAAARHEDQVTIARLRDERTAFEAAVAAREATLAQLRLTTEKERIDWQYAAEARMDKAKAEWRAEEAARFAKTKSEWREETARKLSEADLRTERAEEALAESKARAETDLASARQSDAGELAALREQVSEFTALLMERDRELAELRPATEKARIALQNEMQAQLVKARAEWKAEEKSRMAAAEAQRKQQSADALNEATTRYQIAEAALSQIRKDANAVRAQDHLDVQRLHEKIALLEATLAQYDGAELAQREPSSGAAPSPKIILRTNSDWDALESDKPRSRGLPLRRVARDVVIAGALAASVAIFYPAVAPYLPRSLQQQISYTTNSIGIFLGAPQRNENGTPEEARIARPMAVVSEDVNVRAGPSTATAIVTRLVQGDTVATGEQQGNWRQVQFDAGNGAAEARQGWVYSTFLNEVPAAEVAQTVQAE